MDEEGKAVLSQIRVDIYDGTYTKETAWTKPVVAKSDVGIATEKQGK
jgi:hypothetical protein